MAFLIDAPLLPSGLFSGDINTVVKRFQEAKQQSATFKKLIPHHSRSCGTAAREQPHTSAASSSHIVPKQDGGLHHIIDIRILIL